MQAINKDLQRLFAYIIVFLLFTIIIFSAIEQTVRLETLYSGEDVSQLRLNEQRALEDELMFGSSDFERYFNWVEHLIEGDFGVSRSVVDGASRSVTNILDERLEATLDLLGTSLIIGIFLMIPVLSIQLPSLVVDIIRSLPFFWIPLVFLYIFAIDLGWFPVGGRFPVTFSGDYTFNERLLHLILPATCIGIYIRSGYVRFSRRLDREKTPTLLHMRDFLIANLASITGISLVVEQVFNLPGYGNTLLNAVVSDDYAVAVPLVVIFGFGILLGVIGIWLIFTLLEFARTKLVPPDTIYVVDELSPSTIDTDIDASISDSEPEVQSINNAEDNTKIKNPDTKFPFGKAYRGRLAMIVVMFLFVLIAPDLVGSRPFEPVAARSRLPIGGTFEGETFLLGTDSLGRDQLSRLTLGSVKSLEIAIVAGLWTSVTTFVLIYFRFNRHPRYVQFVTSTLNAIPWLILGVLLLALNNFDTTLLTYITYFASMRIVVEVMLREAIPEKPFSLFLSLFGISVATSLLFVTILGYLEFGIQIPVPSLGNMLSDALGNLRQAPHLLFSPGIVVFVIAFILHTISFRALYKASDEGESWNPPTVRSLLDRFGFNR